MNDLDWATNKAREIFRDLETRGESGPHRLGRWRDAILQKVREFKAGDDSPIRHAEDD